MWCRGFIPSLRARQDLHQLSYMLCSKSIFLLALIGNDSHIAHSWLCYLSRKAFWKVSPPVSAWRSQTLLIQEYQNCIFCLCFHLPQSSPWSHWSNSSIHNETSKFCWIIVKTMVAKCQCFFSFIILYSVQKPTLIFEEEYRGQRKPLLLNARNTGKGRRGSRWGGSWSQQVQFFSWVS